MSPWSRLGRELIEDGGEYDLPGGPDAVLLLHGLTGSTFELLPVARRLQRAGFRCLAPLLAGHGGPTRALVGCVLAHDQPARVDGLALLAPALELTRQGKLGALLARLPFTRGVI